MLFLRLCYYILKVSSTSVWDAPPSLCCAAFTVLGLGCTFFTKAPRPNVCPSDYLCLFPLPSVCASISMLFCSSDLPIAWNRGSFLSSSQPGRPLVLLGHGQDAHRRLWDALHSTLAQQCCHKCVCLCTCTSMNAL